MKHLIFAFLVLVLNIATLTAQVSNINKNVEKDKNNSTNSTTVESSTSYSSGSRSRSRTSSNSSSLGSGLIYFIGNIFIGTIGAVQKASLQNKDMYPERVSLEAFATFGTEISSSANYYETGVRGNWGVFASDFRYSVLNDYTGNLKSIDWLILIIRIPIKSVKIDYGIGFTDLVDLDQSYLKNSIGFDWMLHGAGININSSYQWSEQTSLGTRYKQNFNFSVDFNAFNHCYFYVSPIIKYSYQNYFDETKFSIFSAGIVLRLL